MKAMVLNQKTGADALVSAEIPQPQPKADEVLVKVHATAAMPTETQWVPTFNQKSGEPRPFPIVLSHEFSGTIAALGANVKNLKVGDAIYGLNDWFINGAQAEYCVAAASSVTHKPKSLDHIHSAAVPISALTAWQGLFEKTDLQRGQRVLIHGAAGAVGTFAVQLAHWRGAHIIATASSGNLDFVRSLGADEVIDYHQTGFEDVAHNMDAVFDGVGGETLDRSWKVLKPGGKLVTFSTKSGASKDQRVHDAFMLVRADASQLGEIANLLDSGKLKVIVEEIFPLAKAPEAYQRATQGKMRGKIVLSVTP